jgi:hypothetical protein
LHTALYSQRLSILAVEVRVNALSLCGRFHSQALISELAVQEDGITIEQYGAVTHGHINVPFGISLSAALAVRAR